jgi:hypothetical protein
MSDVYVIRNQLGHYWGKRKAWVDGSEPRVVMRLRHEDEAVNTLVELSARDIELRGEVLSAELSERGEPVIEASAIPVPLTAEELAALEAAEQAGSGSEAAPPAPVEEPEASTSDA